MRGKPNDETSISAHTGITPADAGKTKPTDGHILRKQDHPRGCGENRHCSGEFLIFFGSPPRMRGKHGKASPDQLWWRITPADAGKTHNSRARKPKAKDHPRGCGENSKHSAYCTTTAGSPPRMRGKRAKSNSYNLHDGITPADAGKTRRQSRKSVTARDHPRGCGENLNQCKDKVLR